MTPTYSRWTFALSATVDSRSPRCRTNLGNCCSTPRTTTTAVHVGSRRRQRRSDDAGVAVSDFDDGQPTLDAVGLPCRRSTSMTPLPDGHSRNPCNPRCRIVLPCVLSTFIRHPSVRLDRLVKQSNSIDRVSVTRARRYIAARCDRAVRSVALAFKPLG